MIYQTLGGILTIKKLIECLMDRLLATETPICLFQEKPISISELEAKLQFTYLSKNSFRSLVEEKEIEFKGYEKQKKGMIEEETIALGTQFKEKIENNYSPSLSVRFVNESIQYGLFTEEDLEKGTYLGTYTGLVRKNEIQFLKPLNNYLREYPILDEFGRSYVIDGKQGNLTRFINHSKTPNLKVCPVFYDGFYHLIFMTLEFIKKGSQLSDEYKKNYWYMRKKPLDL